MLIGDAVIYEWVNTVAGYLHYVAPAAGAVLVVVVGKWLEARVKAGKATVPMVDLAAKDPQ
jgi:hypothetical protein